MREMRRWAPFGSPNGSQNRPRGAPLNTAEYFEIFRSILEHILALQSIPEASKCDTLRLCNVLTMHLSIFVWTFAHLDGKTANSEKALEACNYFLEKH